MVLGVASIVAGASAPLAMPIVFGHIITSAMRGAESGDIAAQLAILLMLLIVGTLCSLLSHHLTVRIGYAFAQQLWLKLVDAVLRMPYLTYSTINSGVLVSRLTNDVKMVDSLFVEVRSSIVRSVTVLSAVSVLLVITNPWYSIALLVIPLCYMLVRFAERKIDKSIESSFETSAEVSRVIERNTTGEAIALTRQANGTERAAKEFDAATTKVAATLSEIDFWKESVRVAYDFGFSLIAVAILAVATLAVGGSAGIGSVVTALLYLGMVRAPLSDLISVRYPILRASIGLNRIENVLYSKNAGLDSVVPANPRASAAVSNSAPLRFDRVAFNYPRQERRCGGGAVRY